MRSVWPVATDFFRETFEIDSRIFRTLKLLFFRPGQLSIEFARNRRASYLSPVRLFLFMTLLNLGASAAATSNEWFPARMPACRILPRIRSPRGSRSQRCAPGWIRRRAADWTRFWPVSPKTWPSHSSNWIALEAVSGGGFPPFMYRALIGMYYDPEAVIERLLRRASLVVLLSLPFYALALSVVYFDRRRLFVEHFVLTTHLQSFSLAALLIYLVPARGFVTAGLILAASAGHFLYYLLALRRYFGEGWLKTIARFLVFAFLWLIVSVIGSIVAWQLG